MCLGVLVACLSMCRVHTWCPHQPEEGIRSPAQELHKVVRNHLSAENWTLVPPPQEQHMRQLSTAPPPLFVTLDYLLTNYISVHPMCIAVSCTWYSIRHTWSTSHIRIVWRTTIREIPTNSSATFHYSQAVGAEPTSPEADWLHWFLKHSLFTHLQTLPLSTICKLRAFYVLFKC